MARILLHTLVFAPDGVSTAYLMKDLAVELQRRGNTVTVLTSVPHYNLEPRAIEAYGIRTDSHRVQRGEVEGVVVWHLPMQQKGSRVAARLADYIKFHLRALWFIFRTRDSYDVVLAPSPPLTIGMIAWLMGSLRNVPTIYNVQELYPDFAVNSGLVRNPLVIGVFKLLETLVYEVNSMMTVISEPFAQTLRARGVPESKIRVIPNFVDETFYRPLPRRNAFSLKHSLNDTFVVLYAGNIGLSQDWDAFLFAAQALREHPITFAVSGDGVRGDWLRREVESRALTNVRVFGYLPREEMPFAYASADLGTIPMMPKTTTDTFPSKIYTLFACGKPVVVHADPGSELERTVRASECGQVVAPGDTDGYTAAIFSAYERRASLAAEGARGREYVERGYSKEAVAKQYEDAIEFLVRKNKSS